MNHFKDQQKIYDQYINTYINHKHPLINKKQFAKWFVGFTDGDGSFNVSIKNNNISFGFIITQHSCNYLLLHFIKQNLNLKSIIKKDKNAYTIYINSEDIENIIIPFFKKHKLKSSKSLEFKYFNQAWDIYKSKTLNKYQKCKKINNLIKPDRKQYQLKNNIKINDFWLNGYIEADGSFYLKITNGRLYHTFSITKTFDSHLLNIIKQYIDNKHLINSCSIYTWNYNKKLVIANKERTNNANKFFTEMYTNTFNVGIKSLQFKIWSQSLIYTKSILNHEQLKIAQQYIKKCKDIKFK